MVDQNSQFYAILTNVGAAKQANADALGIAWKITHMGVGDANGADPTPDATQTRLINEWRRAPLNQLKVDDKDASIIIAEQVIPADIGGKWIREIGLYDEAGDLVAVANCAPTYKPVLSQGSGRTQVLRMSLVVSSAANVQLKIDPSVVLATREWVTEELARQDFKHSVLAATTANIALSGLQTIDGVPLTAGARVLVKNQITARDNGLYTVVPGAAWSRCDDANSSAKVTPGLLVLVEKGTVNSDSAWQLVTDAPITLGVTALSFEMAFGRSGVAAGTYRSVQVDKYGRVVAATNPTTVAGYGITDVYTKSETFSRAETTSAIATAVASAVAGLVDSSPAALDTLKELAMAIGNDPNFATTMVNELAKKAPLVSPVLTGDPRAPTPSVGDNDTSIATTAFVQAAMAAFGVGTQSPALITDLNLATSGGFWRAAGGAANSVGTGAVTGFTVPYNGTGCLQILSQLTAAGSPLHWRSQVAGVWSDWTPFAGLLSPVLTGDPKAPTPPVGDSDTSIATTAFVQEAMKAFGLGQNKLATSVADIDDPTLATGWYQVGSVTTGNKPETFGILLVSSRNSVNATTGRINQIFYRTDGAVWAAWGRVWKAGFGGWSDWSTQATLESPVFTGDPKAPTPPMGDNDTSVATTAFVHNTLASLGWGTPDLTDLPTGVDLNTLNVGGSYQVNGAVNAPAGYGGILFVVGTNAQYYTHQLMFPQNVNKIFHRCSYGATNGTANWRDWVEVPDLTTVTALIKSGRRYFSGNIVGVGVNTTLTAAQTGLAFNATAAVTFTLPAAADAGSGGTFSIRNVSPGNVTIALTSGQIYENNAAASTAVLKPGEWVEVQASATSYFINSRGKLGEVAETASPTFTGEAVFKGANVQRFIHGTQRYGLIQRVDDNAYYLLLTDAGNSTGNFNALRPLKVDLATGAVTMSHGTYVQSPADDDDSTQAVPSSWVKKKFDMAAPVGQVAHFARSTPPPGWLKRNGAAISRATYASLFEVIGTQFGAGNGSTTFNVPDDRELIDRAWTDGLNSADVGRTLFSAQTGQIESHSHTGTALSAGVHTHNITNLREYVPGTTDGNINAVYGDQIIEGTSTTTTSSGGAHSHTLSINATGGNETRMANRAYLACIKY